jgi:HNH endonuclease
MRRINRSGRYVETTRSDGRFLVNRVNNQTKISSYEIPLKICQNCLNRLAFDNFSFSLPRGERTRIVLRFTIARFFEKYPRSLLHSLPTGDAATAPINHYSADFDDISKHIRERRGWRCESCRRDFSRATDREYLHVHHKNGMKNENHGENLQVLCLGCHADEPQHAHLKKLAEYREFVRRFGLYR